MDLPASPDSPTGVSPTPKGLREGVRDALLTSLERDLDQRGAATLRRLLAAGVVGVVGALGATLLVAHHPFGHHAGWHEVVVSTVWAGLLILALALAFLRIRMPGLGIGQAAQVGILALGLAGVCGSLCSDQHFLSWWSASPIGSQLLDAVGLPVSAACFGLVAAFAFAALSTLVVARPARTERQRSVLPAAMITLLLLPGIALQAVGTSPGVFVFWFSGVALGAYLGVAGVLAGRDALRRMWH